MLGLPGVIIVLQEGEPVWHLLPLGFRVVATGGFSGWSPEPGVTQQMPGFPPPGKELDFHSRRNAAAYAANKVTDSDPEAGQKNVARK